MPKRGRGYRCIIKILCYVLYCASAARIRWLQQSSALPTASCCTCPTAHDDSCRNIYYPSLALHVTPPPPPFRVRRGDSTSQSSVDFSFPRLFSSVDSNARRRKQDFSPLDFPSYTCVVPAIKIITFCTLIRRASLEERRNDYNCYHCCLTITYLNY